MFLKEPPLIKRDVPRRKIDLEPLPNNPIGVPQNKALDTSTFKSEIVELSSEIEYSPVSSDEVFRYRVVELPFPLAQHVPLRNLCEAEWRSLGIQMGPGWENYGRRSCEFAVLLFRKPIDEDSAVQVWKEEWKRYAELSHSADDKVEDMQQLSRMFIFPIKFFETNTIPEDSALWNACDKKDGRAILKALVEELERSEHSRNEQTH